MRAGVQADRIARALAAQYVPPAVHPHRARAQHRGWPAFPRPPRRRSSWPRHSRSSARRRRAAGPRARPGRPRAPRPLSLPNGPARSGPGPTSARAWQRWTAAAGQGAERQRARRSALRPARRLAPRRSRGRALRRTGVRLRGDEQDGLGEPAISGATDMSAVNGTSFVSSTGRPERAPARQRSAESRCQRQHEGQDTRSIRAATPDGHRGSGLRGLAWPKHTRRVTAGGGVLRVGAAAVLCRRRAGRGAARGLSGRRPGAGPRIAPCPR